MKILIGLILIAAGCLAIWARNAVSDFMNVPPLQWRIARTHTARSAVLLGIGWIVAGAVLIFSR